MKFYKGEGELHKIFAKAVKKTPKAKTAIQQRIQVLASRGDCDKAKAKYKALYVEPRAFLSSEVCASKPAVCPGFG